MPSPDVGGESVPWFAFLNLRLAREEIFGGGSVTLGGVTGWFWPTVPSPNVTDPSPKRGRAQVRPDPLLIRRDPLVMRRDPLVMRRDPLLIRPDLLAYTPGSARRYARIPFVRERTQA